MSTYGKTGAEGAPVCPRHPGVVTYVRCQRCGRPTCPACQRTAPVGIHCVDCVSKGASAVRQKRTSGGALAVERAPIVTYLIIGIAALVTLLQQVIPTLTSDLMFVPVFATQEPWRFLTSMFAHGGIWHIALNGYALYLVGPPLERVLGHARFLALVLLSAFGGSVAVLLLASPSNLSWVTGVVGASGAVFGLFAALAITMRRLKRSDSQLLVLIGINLVIGFVVAGVSWQAHIGGLLTGAALAAAYLYTPRKHMALMAWAAPLVIAAALIALTLIGANG